MKNIVTVHHPVLTEEERARRMEEIKRAAIKLLLVEERINRQKERERAEAERRAKDDENA